ncbi:hypothetical protein SH1V18_37090 [Vallitalea longa]|uniref:Uncharacterized protein n=1 Tax=Vallitalea longa TaxID=2936439 RepID=A0A9W5YDU7_9FIRM|nr:hypothetical protein [Vallitalea longa]GKX31229.1 hypothetical protein SH1V18_37090 [Vallitalea longa]
MNKENKKYVNKVLRRIDCSTKYKKRIRNDLHMMLEDKAMELGETDPYKLLGDAEQVAEEFAENMGVSLFTKYQYVSEKKFMGMPLIQINNNNRRYYEYKSQRTIMGIPLIHVNHKPFGVAKGIIAIGNISIGVISFGCVSIGVISFGAISFAVLLSLGALALAGVFAIGGVAVAGLFALGGAAYSGYVSIGGAAMAKEFACGGYARAKVAIGDKINAKVGYYYESGHGEYARKVVEGTQLSKDYIFNKVPELSDFVRGLIEKCIYLINNDYMHFN